MKVVLVFSRLRYTSGDPPIGLCQLAAIVEEQTDARVEIVDSSFHQNISRLKRDIQEKNPDLIGVFVDTSMYSAAVWLLSMLKGEGAGRPMIVCGGPHATVLPETLIDHCDAVIVGEGEIPLCRIVQTFPNVSFESVPGIVARQPEGTVLRTEKPPPIDMDTLPLPALEKVDLDRYADYWSYLDSLSIGLRGTNLIASRGCPHACTYCQPTLRGLFGHRMRHRSPDRVLADMEAVRKRFGIDCFYFHDDTFTQNSDWVHAFCDLLIRHDHRFLWGVNVRADSADEELLRHMHEAGLRVIHLGIESASQAVLDTVYRKRTTLVQVEATIDRARKLDIKVLGFFMLGAPGESLADVRKTVAYAISLPLDEATFNMTTPLPGTHLYDRLVTDPDVSVSEDFRDYDYYRQQAFSNPNVPATTLKRIQFRALVRFYLTPHRLPYLLRHFLSLKGIRKLLVKMERFLKVRQKNAFDPVGIRIADER